MNLTFAYAGKQMYAEAFAVMQQNNANNPEVAAAQEKAYAEGGFLRAARIRADNLAQQSQRMYVSPSGVAAAYARAGERQPALDWLEKSFEERETVLVNLGAGRTWDWLRGDPRFEAIRSRMKFPN